MWHVEDVGDVILIVFVCNAIYVEDVEDRSNIPKGCNAMYVGDVEDLADEWLRINRSRPVVSSFCTGLLSSPGELCINTIIPQIMMQHFI